MWHRLAAVALIALGAVGCKDHLTQPAPGEIPALRLDTRADSVSVTDFSAQVVNGDWAPAIQAAVNAGRNVFFPAGTYTIKSASAIVARPVPGKTHRGSVELHSNTRVYGVGASSKIVVQDLGFAIMDSAHHVFMAYHPTETRENITVESLGFEGSGLNQSDAALRRGATRKALWVSRGRQIAFRNNHVVKLGLVETSTDWTHATFDTTNWTRNVEISDNTGIGKDVYISSLSIRPAYIHGVMLGYVRGATVANNYLQGYHSAVQWHGGHAPAYSDGAFGAPKWAQDLHIANNHVRDVDSGIWGSMGWDVRVFDNNPVARCLDVCLDAEGSDSVRFLGNVASNAGSGVLANFFYSDGIYFAWNTVSQDGSLGRTLYVGKNEHQVTTPVRVRVHNNQFSFTGASGVGRLAKEASRYFLLANNTFSNVVVDMAHFRNGTAQIVGNTFNVDRSTGGMPVILYSNAHGADESGNLFLHAAVSNGFHVEIAGNQISTTADQWYTTAIRSRQDTTVAVRVWIHANRIEGFYNSIGVGAKFADPFFRIEGNERTGQIYRDNTITSWYLGSNPWIDPVTPDPGDDSGGGCEPPPGQFVCTEP